MITRQLATAEDAVWVGMHLRDADVQEVLTIHPDSDPVEVVVRAFLLSPPDCFALRSNEHPNPIALFGCLPDPKHDGFGIMWLLGTSEIRGKGLRILRTVTPWLSEWCRQYPRGIHNLLDARNELHLRWCLLAGFRIIDPPHRINGVDFLHIHRHPEATPLV